MWAQSIFLLLGSNLLTLVSSSPVAEAQTGKSYTNWDWYVASRFQALRGLGPVELAGTQILTTAHHPAASRPARGRTTRTRALRRHSLGAPQPCTISSVTKKLISLLPEANYESATSITAISLRATP